MEKKLANATAALDLRAIKFMEFSDFRMGYQINQMKLLKI